MLFPLVRLIKWVFAKDVVVFGRQNSLFKWEVWNSLLAAWSAGLVKLGQGLRFRVYGSRFRAEELRLVSFASAALGAVPIYLSNDCSQIPITAPVPVSFSCGYVKVLGAWLFP